ncbi:metal-dependent transcriptional regulator, partial [bacterium]|nr:metal-dependent transcriptional regulator [bacterium]
GKKVAKRLSRRHKALANFFEKVLFVDADIAQESAIRVEHVIDEELFSRFVAFADFLESCPKVGIMWQEDRGFSCAKYGKENLCGCACPVPSGHDVPEEKHIKVRVGLDAMPVGTGGKIKRLPLDITVREMCVQAGFSAGSYLTVTARDKNACTVTVQINNSEKTISADDAAHIIIKPSAIPLRLLGEGSKAVIRYVAEPVAEELAAIGVMPNAECAVSAIHSDTETIDVVLNDSQAALSFTQAEKIQVIPFA